MYCERYKCTMLEKTCIARHGYHKKSGIGKNRSRVANDPGCAKCAQGEKVYKQYLKDKNMTGKKQEIKICAHCKQGKPADLDHYYKDARSKDDLGSWCIECQKLSSEAAGKKKVKENKKKVFEKGGLVSEKQEPLLPFDSFAIPAIGKTLVLNFTEHEDLLADIKAAAEEYFRTPEMQVLWWLTTRDKLMTGEGE